MVTTFGCIILLLLAFIIYKKLNNRYQEETFREKMFALRDELRNLALEDKVNSSSIEFDYIDFSISKNIEESYFITLFYIFGLEIRHSQAEKTIEDYKNEYDKLQESILKNEYLQDIFIRKNILTHQYLSGQNRLTSWIFGNVFFAIKGMLGVKKYFKNKISEINYFPELSGVKINK